MRVLSIKYLIFIGVIFFLLLSSCSPNYLKNYTKLESNSLSKPTLFDSNFLKTIYKTKLSVVGNQLSGIMLIKKTTNQEYRFVFVSEIGLKYFDIGIKKSCDKQELKTYYLMPALKRGTLEQVLLIDFSKLITNGSASIKPTYYQQNSNSEIAIKYDEQGLKTIYFLEHENQNIERISWNHSPTGRSEIILSNYTNSIPQQIEIINNKYGLKIEMIEIVND